MTSVRRESSRKSVCSEENNALQSRLSYTGIESVEWELAVNFSSLREPPTFGKDVGQRIEENATSVLVEATSPAGEDFGDSLRRKMIIIVI